MKHEHTPISMKQSLWDNGHPEHSTTFVAREAIQYNRVTQRWEHAPLRPASELLKPSNSRVSYSVSNSDDKLMRLVAQHGREQINRLKKA
jgi:hypothetical protein